MLWYNIPVSMPMIRRFRDVDEEISSQSEETAPRQNSAIAAPDGSVVAWGVVERLSRTAAEYFPWGSDSSVRREMRHLTSVHFILDLV